MASGIHSGKFLGGECVMVWDCYPVAQSQDSGGRSFSLNHHLVSDANFDSLNLGSWIIFSNPFFNKITGMEHPLCLNLVIPMVLFCHF